MSRKFLSPLNLPSVTVLPATGTLGDVVYKSDESVIYSHNGLQWVASGGPIGPSGVVSVTSPVTNTGTSTSAVIGVNASSSDIANYLVQRDVNYTASLGGLQLDTSNIPASGVGKITWDSASGTPQVGLVGGNVTLQIGQEQVALVRNAESTTLTDGQVVYLYGAQGDHPTVKRASNSSEGTSSKAFGMVTEPIAAGQLGFVTVQGTVNGLNLSAYNPGDILWLGSTPGSFTVTKPVAPAHAVFVGVVQKANSGNGGVYVSIQVGYELDELHNVVTSGVQDNYVLTYEQSSNLYKMKPIPASNYLPNIDGGTAGTVYGGVAYGNIDGGVAGSIYAGSIYGGDSGSF